MNMTAWIKNPFQCVRRTSRFYSVRKNTRPQHRAPALIESLEQRRLLSAIAAATGTLGLSGMSQTTEYDQKSAAVAIAPNLVVTAPAGDQLQSATVTFANWMPEDRMTFYNSAGLQHTFTVDASSHTATLAISGAASAAAYETMLRSVSYQDVAGNPNTTSVRVATYTINDVTASASASQNIHVVAVLGGLNQTQTYLQGQSPMSVMPDLKITVPSTQMVTGATVKFTNWQTEDRLAFYNSAALQHTMVIDSSAHTATLTLTGSATAAAYQTELQSITYQDVAGKPNTTALRNGTISLSAGNYSAIGQQTVRATTVLQGFGQIQTYMKGAAAINIVPNAVVTLPAGVQATGATLTIANWQASEDHLSAGTVAGLQTLITVNALNHVATLAITGTASASDYQNLLRSLQYQNSSQTPVVNLIRTATMVLNYGSTNATAKQSIRVVTS